MTRSMKHVMLERASVCRFMPRIYNNIKPVFDLDKVCRDLLDIAYISRSSQAAPCCHWMEAQIPVDYYNDEKGFENYWNSDLLRRLRNKRNFASCQVCGMSRIFDETSFTSRQC